MHFRWFQASADRHVEGQEVYAERSMQYLDGVYITVRHHETAVYGHLTRDDAVALRNTLTRLLRRRTR